MIYLKKLCDNFLPHIDRNKDTLGCFNENCPGIQSSLDCVRTKTLESWLRSTSEKPDRVLAPCPYQKPRRATTRSYSYCMPVTFRNNSKGKRPATKNKVRIANGHTARSAFPHERLQASFNQGICLPGGAPLVNKF